MPCRPTRSVVTVYVVVPIDSPGTISPASALYAKAFSGTDSEQALLVDGTNNRPMDWSPDGRFIPTGEIRGNCGPDQNSGPINPADP
jgi:hypothetical protein